MDYRDYKAQAIRQREESLEHYGVLGMHWGKRKNNPEKMGQNINKAMTKYDRSLVNYDKALTQFYKNRASGKEKGKYKVTVKLFASFFRGLKLESLDKEYKLQTGKSYVEKKLNDPKYQKLNAKTYTNHGISEHEVLARTNKGGN